MDRCGQPEANLTEVRCLDRLIRNGSPAPKNRHLDDFLSGDERNENELMSATGRCRYPSQLRLFLRSLFQTVGAHLRVF